MKNQSFTTLKRLGVFLVLLTVLIGYGIVKSNDIYTDISKNLTVFGQIYKEVTRRYVDTVDPEKFLKAGIDGMLSTLDPYTTYFEREEQQQLQILTHGKYEGVGLLLNLRNNIVTVAEPPAFGTPSARAGIREGDHIMKVNGTSTEGLEFEETVRRILGPKGTEVKLTIQREGEEKALEFTLLREEITVEDVRYSGVLDGQIGYIRLVRFSKNSGPEVSRAIQSLLGRGIRGLILDLRSNPGGMLESAADVCECFLPKNSLIVSTRGRTSGSVQEFRSTRDPIYGNLPLLVLVNRFSASASEIVAGAIQDQDRGMVLGDSTFGKGLVQTVVPLSASSALKITTAKYYTPSGRCIQKQTYSVWEDSLQENSETPYRTSNGRPVSGGGGIAPDMLIPTPTTSDFILDLYRKSMFFNFAVSFANSHTNPDSHVVITPVLLQDFQKYMKDKKYEYRHPLETSLSQFKVESLTSGYDSVLLQDVDKLLQDINRTKDVLFQMNVNEIKRQLRLELASKLYGVKKEMEISLEDDPLIVKSRDLINNPSMYLSLLGFENKKQIH